MHMDEETERAKEIMRDLLFWNMLKQSKKLIDRYGE